MSSINTEDFRLLFFEVASDDFFDVFDLNLAAEFLFGSFLRDEFKRVGRSLRLRLDEAEDSSLGGGLLRKLEGSPFG